MTKNSLQEIETASLENREKMNWCCVGPVFVECAGGRL